MRSTIDTSMLEMALIGYEAERQKIQARITEIQAQLNGRSGHTATPVTRTRRKMSATARRRIAAAQKKRWAEYHKQQKAA
jgi:hypothetical protein